MSNLSPIHKIRTKDRLLSRLQPTITQGEFTTNIDPVQKELEDYFAGNQRLKYYAVLDHIIYKGWEVTTKEIKEITGLKPRGKIYSYGSYKFRRVGKAGRNILWAVYKEIEYFSPDDDEKQEMELTINSEDMARFDSQIKELMSIV